MFDLSGIIDTLSEDIFEERPVDLDTFMGPGYLDMSPNPNKPILLSSYQKELIERSTQIYRLETLVLLYGADEAKKIIDRTVKEVICVLGKGSGKDFCSVISCLYLVHKLLCLRDPQAYFGKPPGDAIDIVNVAVNAEQARRVFFNNAKQMAKRSPWFANKMNTPKAQEINFSKNINLYSAHSEADAFEGLNLIMVILDEISGFSMFSTAGKVEKDSPAQATYNMYNDSLTSRFPDEGKLILLSFPRSNNDFIMTRYANVIGEKDAQHRSHTFIIDESRDFDAEGNSFSIEWTEDHILRYAESKVWALRRPSWEVNPTKVIENYQNNFRVDPANALGKFAAEPGDGSGGFFPDHQQVDKVSTYANGCEPDGVFKNWFEPEKDKEYFITIDLARKHDRAVVAMAHVHKYVAAPGFNGKQSIQAYVKVDCIRYWTPNASTQVDFSDVRDFAISLHQRGFSIKLVTLDQWQSEELIMYFNNYGIKAEMKSVALPHYTDLRQKVMESRVEMPKDDILRRELKQVYLLPNGKNVDHPRAENGSKDISDAVAGAVFNADLYTERDTFGEIEILTSDDFRATNQDRPKMQIDPPRIKNDRDREHYEDLLRLF